MTDETKQGPLAGTESERAPGVGGLGDHPAPAAMLDEDGVMRQHGETPSTAAQQAPVGDGFEEQVGDVTDPEAQEKLDAVVEPEPYEIKRPDLGTE